MNNSRRLAIVLIAAVVMMATDLRAQQRDNRAPRKPPTVLFAGHSSITTTQRYMNARASSLAESMRQARERRVNRVEHGDEATAQIG